MSTLFQTIPGQSWSSVDERCLKHSGCIVDLGCLMWDWSRCFVHTKRVIGVDPQENAIPGTTLFKGAIANKTGKAILNGVGEAAQLVPADDGFDTLTWRDFVKQYDIGDISVLKINIEGSEYDLIQALTPEDFDRIDQIAVSFHHWINPTWQSKTDNCLRIIAQYDYDIRDLGVCGWHLCVKRSRSLDA